MYCNGNFLPDVQRSRCTPDNITETNSATPPWWQQEENLPLKRKRPLTADCKVASHPPTLDQDVNLKVPVIYKEPLPQKKRGKKAEKKEAMDVSLHLLKLKLWGDIFLAWAKMKLLAQEQGCIHLHDDYVWEMCKTENKKPCTSLNSLPPLPP